MNSVDMALNFGSVVNVIGVILLLRTVIKDRNILRGYSVSGCFLTLLAIGGFQIAFFLMENMVSFVLGLFTAVFWLVAFVYSLRQMIKQATAQKKETSSEPNKQ